MIEKLTFKSSNPTHRIDLGDGKHVAQFQEGRLSGGALELGWLRERVDEGKVKGVSYEVEEAEDGADRNREGGGEGVSGDSLGERMGDGGESGTQPDGEAPKPQRRGRSQG